MNCEVTCGLPFRGPTKYLKLKRATLTLGTLHRLSQLESIIQILLGNNLY